jgi:hypothetical protein
MIARRLHLAVVTALGLVCLPAVISLPSAAATTRRLTIPGAHLLGSTATRAAHGKTIPTATVLSGTKSTPAARGSVRTIP